MTTSSPTPSDRPRRSRRRLRALAAAIGALAVGGAFVAAVVLTGGGGPPTGIGAREPMPPDAPTPAAERASRPTAAEIDRALDAARVYVKKGEGAKAETTLLALLARVPDEADAHTAMAEAMLSLGKPAEALASYERALALGEATPDLAFGAGTAASMAGKPADAERWYLIAQRLDPGNPQRPLYLAQAQRALGKIDEAKASLLRAAQIDPGIAPAWGTLADIALGEGSLSVAWGHIARARRAEPTNALWRLLEARILRRDNEPETAARLLLGLTEQELTRSDALLDELAMCYAMLGRTGDAASLYVRASAARREDAELASRAAEWLERADRRDEAEIFASAAARLGSERGRAILKRLRGE